MVTEGIGGSLFFKSRSWIELSFFHWWLSF